MKSEHGEHALCSGLRGSICVRTEAENGENGGEIAVITYFFSDHGGMFIALVVCVRQFCNVMSHQTASPRCITTILNSIRRRRFLTCSWSRFCMCRTRCLSWGVGSGGSSLGARDIASCYINPVFYFTSTAAHLRKSKVNRSALVFA